MPTLDWLGKQAVVNHHREVPTRLLHCDSELSFGDPDAGNLLVQGDNLEALKALLPYYAGKVKCVYIDPPYNTGNEGWAYNDNVNSAEIRGWLNKVVGKEAEDLSRHDKWLCMMYPRICMLEALLANDGVLLCSINDVELHNLKQILRDVFGSQNELATFIWVNEGNIDNQSKIKVNHEYVVAFAKRGKDFKPGAVVDPNIEAGSKLQKEKISNTIVKNGPANPVSEILLPRGFPANFEEGEIQPSESDEFWPKLSEVARVRNSKLENPVRVRSGWSSKAQCELFIAAGFHDIIDRKGQATRFHITSTGAVYVEKDRAEDQSHVLSVLSGLGTVQEAAAKLAHMGVDFDYPKPDRLISYLISAVCPDRDALILDSFAGSGTTGQAVMQLNAQDRGGRRCILVEMNQGVATGVTAKRLKAANDQLPTTEGYRYCNLGKPLFDEWGGVTQGVGFADLAAFVFFSDTGSPIPAKASPGSSLLGTFQGRAIHLLFSEDSVGVASAAAGNVLTLATLEALPPFDGPRVVYGEGCTVPADRLAAAGVVFKQVPYQLQAT
ncbi:MAG: site-specific DNA-methyltransferase [Caulobacter sp.]